MIVWKENVFVFDFSEPLFHPIENNSFIMGTGLNHDCIKQSLKGYFPAQKSSSKLY